MSYGISGQIFGLISSFLSKRRLRVVLDGKSSQEYSVHAGFPQGSILYSHPTPSKFLECKFSSKSGEVLNLGPICLKRDFRYNC